MQRATHLFGRALRETGQAIDRLGLTFSNNEIYKETFSRHRQVMNLFDKVINPWVLERAKILLNILSIKYFCNY